MDNLQLVLTHMAYGAVLWVVLLSVVAGVWFVGFRIVEHRQRTRWARAWNEWMGFTK